MGCDGVSVFSPRGWHKLAQGKGEARRPGLSTRMDCSLKGCDTLRHPLSQPFRLQESDSDTQGVALGDVVPGLRPANPGLRPANPGLRPANPGLCHKRSRGFHSIAAILIALILPSASLADDGFDRDVKPFLKAYCQRCHHADKQTAGVRVDHLDAKLEDRTLKLWDHVLRLTRDGAMPPEDATQPKSEERKCALAWMEKNLQVARLRPTPKNGSVRRLTVAQYKNTLRELLQLEDNVAEILPPDAVSKDGFVNNQETLQLSPLLLEAYFDIADTALSRSIVDPKAKPVIQNFRLDFGAGLNKAPIKDNLILGADSTLLDKRDFVVEELKADKPFAFEPFKMRTKYRFIEGYAGNDTVRGWREYNSIYHSVFADMRGTHGYPKGLRLLHGAGRVAPAAGDSLQRDLHRVEHLRPAGELQDRTAGTARVRPLSRHRNGREIRRRSAARSRRGIG